MIIWKGYLGLWDRLIGRKTVIVDESKDGSEAENVSLPSGITRNPEFARAEAEAFEQIKRELGK